MFQAENYIFFCHSFSNLVKYILNEIFNLKAYVYEPDSEAEVSSQAELTYNTAQETETDGTLTPTPGSSSKRKKRLSDDNSVHSDIATTSSHALNSKRFLKALENQESLTESEYYTALSEFNTDSANSSSIWK